MNQSNDALLAFALGLALVTSVACSDHNVFLVGRDTLPARAVTTSRSEIVGTVARLDSATNEINLRASPGRPGMVTYSAETRVMHRGQSYPVRQLRSGDVVACDSSRMPVAIPIRMRSALKTAPEIGLCVIMSNVAGDSTDLPKPMFRPANAAHEILYGQRPGRDNLRQVVQYWTAT